MVRDAIVCSDEGLTVEMSSAAIRFPTLMNFSVSRVSTNADERYFYRN